MNLNERTAVNLKLVRIRLDSVAILVSEILDLVSPKDFGMT